MNIRNVELRIEELVLEGFEQHHPYRIARAVEREFMRLFAEHGIPSSFLQKGRIDHLENGAFEVAPGARAEAIGVQVAQAVYLGWRQ